MSTAIMLSSESAGREYLVIITLESQSFMARNNNITFALELKKPYGQCECL
jgi:hypothetical protein